MILFPEDITDECAIGGKARNLFMLGQAGFAVPEWFAPHAVSILRSTASADAEAKTESATPSPMVRKTLDDLRLSIDSSWLPFLTAAQHFCIECV